MQFQGLHGNTFCYLLSPCLGESLRVALGLYPSKERTSDINPICQISSSLACAGCCMAVSGSLLPPVVPLVPVVLYWKQSWEGAESRVMETCRAGTVGLAPSLEDTWLHGQSPVHHLLVPQLEPSLGVIHTHHPALFHTPVPAAR